MSRTRSMVFLLALLLLAGSASAAEPKDAVSGQRALEHVRELVRFGGRVPGSPNHGRAQRYIIRQLRHASAGEIEEVDFVAQTPRGKVRMKNIIAKFPGPSREMVVLAGHYDTLAQENFIGANDGGSSTALLLELARVLGRRKNPLTVWVVFFDGEEAFKRFSPTDGFYGSRHQVSAWKADGILDRIKALIVVDMIGDKNLNLRRERNSTAWLVDLVWQIARASGHGIHFLDQTTVIEDDHVPFVQAGVPAVDLIDLDYGPGNRYWHTPDDTVDKVSARSMEIVGEVVLKTVERLGRRWPGQKSH